MTAPRVGFVGLGFMGHGMASNIRKCGYSLVVLAHRRREAVDDLVQRGAREARTAAELAAESDIVVLCVGDAAQVDALVRRPDGLAEGARAGLIVVDCTTSDPATLLQLAADFPTLTFVDAPLGRTPAEAWSGKLSTMVGCEANVMERIRPVLSTYATTIQRAGGPGAGHRLKLVNNFISLGLGALYAEALVMARKAGFTTSAFDELVRSSRMHSAFYDTFIAWARDGDTRSHPFALRNALQTTVDLGALQRRLGVDSQLASGIEAVYRRAVAAGDGDAMLNELPRSVAAASDLKLRNET